MGRLFGERVLLNLQDQKIKIWYGAGTAECDSSDNVYYTECSDLSEGFSKPKRITTNDSTGYKLVDRRAN